MGERNWLLQNGQKGRQPVDDMVLVPVTDYNREFVLFKPRNETVNSSAVV